jgi:hypothetical protein
MGTTIIAFRSIFLSGTAAAVDRLADTRLREQAGPAQPICGTGTVTDDQGNYFVDIQPIPECAENIPGTLGDLHYGFIAQEIPIENENDPESDGMGGVCIVLPDGLAPEGLGGIGKTFPHSLSGTVDATSDGPTRLRGTLYTPPILAQGSPPPGPPAPAPAPPPTPPLPEARPGIRVNGDPTFQAAVAHCFELYDATPGPLRRELMPLLRDALTPPTNGIATRTVTIEKWPRPASFTHDLSAPAFDGSTRINPANAAQSIAGRGASALIGITTDYETANPRTVLKRDEAYFRHLTPEEVRTAQALYPAGALDSERSDPLMDFCTGLIHELGHAYDILMGMEETSPLGGGAFDVPNPNDPPREIEDPPGSGIFRFETPDDPGAHYSFLYQSEVRAVYWENAFRIYHPPYAVRTTYDTYPLPASATSTTPDEPVRTNLPSVNTTPTP